TRTAPATATPRARARRPRQTAPAATPAPEPVPAPTPEPQAAETVYNIHNSTTESTPTPAASPTVSDNFQQRVQALLALVAEGEDAVAEALRRGTVRMRLPRAGRSGSRAPRNNGLPCSVRQGTYLLYLSEHGTFQKGTSKVRSELHRLGLTDSD